MPALRSQLFDKSWLVQFGTICVLSRLILGNQCNIKNECFEMASLEGKAWYCIISLNYKVMMVACKGDGNLDFRAPIPTNLQQQNICPNLAWGNARSPTKTYFQKGRPARPPIHQQKTSPSSLRPSCDGDTATQLSSPCSITFHCHKNYVQKTNFTYCTRPDEELERGKITKYLTSEVRSESDRHYDIDTCTFTCESKCFTCVQRLKPSKPTVWTQGV